MVKSKNLHPTAIKGLDEVLEGGIPTGNTILLSGKAGTGKTTLSLAWLFRGYEKYGEQGVYLGITESIPKIVRNSKNMGFFQKEASDIHLVDLREAIDLEKKINKKSEIKKLAKQIKKYAPSKEKSRLVIDSVTALGYLIDDRELFRRFIFNLGKELSDLNCTSFLISEAGKGEEYTKFGVEDYICDGLIYVENITGEQKMIRNINIVKMRGKGYRTGKVRFDIDSKGITVYPKIPINLKTIEKDLSKKINTGIDNLDQMLNGGYPKGHVVLLGGSTGTGKTTFGLQFLEEGLKNGEIGLFVNLEEPINQIKQVAETYNWDFDKYQEEGLLYFISPKLIDTYPDRVLHKIIDKVKKEDIKRVFFDSTSSLLSEAMHKEKVRQFLLQLTSLFREKNITSVFTYLSEELGTERGKIIGGKASSIRLSSVTDGIILLRYKESEKEVKKNLNILKMRGSNHDRSIKEYEFTEKGIEIK